MSFVKKGKSRLIASASTSDEFVRVCSPWRFTKVLLSANNKIPVVSTKLGIAYCVKSSALIASLPLEEWTTLAGTTEEYTRSDGRNSTKELNED